MEMTKISNKTPRRLLLLFEILSLILMFTYRMEEIDEYTILTGIGLVLLVYISNFILGKISKGDHYIFLIATMLMSIGVIMIYRLDPHQGFKQLIWVSLGIICFFLTYFILKYIGIWDKLEYLYIFAAYGLFFLTLALGTMSGGAKNWITIGEKFSFQPAEIIKLILIFLLATFYAKKETEEIDLSNTRDVNIEELRLKSKWEKYDSLIIMGIVYSFIALLFLQKDLGMSLIFYGIFLVIQFIYEEDRRLIFLNIALFSVAGILGYMLFDHVKVRFDIWLDPWKTIDGKGYQITQSLMAIAEGGFFGTGLGLGHPEFIPLAYNDFIFSAIIEEMGIFTGIGIIMLFMILVYRGFKIALNQRNRFFQILAVGVSGLFGVQSFIILGGVLKVIPLTGITLPFIAYGGTSILSSFIALGVLQVASEDVEWRDE